MANGSNYSIQKQEEEIRVLQRELMKDFLIGHPPRGCHVSPSREKVK
jgi:hypothetical protein